MAYENDNGIADVSLTAGASFTSSQYLAVDVSTAADGACVLASAAGQPVMGILQNAPASGAQARIRCAPGTISKWVCGGSVTRGDLLKTDANGACVTASKAVTDTQAGSATDALIGSYVLARALASGDAADIIPVLIIHAGAVATTAA